MLIIERWLLGRLRHRCFYNPAELNATIGDLLHQLNEERPIRRLSRALLEELDRPNLKDLPGEPYSFAEWLASLDRQPDPPGPVGWKVEPRSSPADNE